MYRLIYISTAADALTADEMDALVESSIRNNTERRVTGVLVYNGLNFLQLLEGLRTDVEAIYNRIQVDARHVSVTTVLAEPAKDRIFPDWHMTWRKSRALAGDHTFHTVRDTGDVMDHAMPDDVRKIFTNFVSLKGI